MPAYPSRMRIRSLELRSTLMINAMYGLVEEREAPGVGAYLAVRTPSVPDYWYGNCLAMPGLPAAGELPLWESLFEREHPGAGHRVFLLDAPEGIEMRGHGALSGGYASTDEPAVEGRSAATRAGLDEFVAAGYELSAHDVLATEAIRRPALLNEEFDYRPVRTDGEWAAVFEASLAINAGQPGYTRGFLERKFKAVRSAVEGGHGAWWAAWEPLSGSRVWDRSGGRPVANLGLFWSGGLARFQDVETDPDFRRRGICRSLVYSACASITADGGGARRSPGAPRPATLFVIKPEDEAVRRIYEAVGFSFLERSVDLCRLVARD